ncbi:MAG: Sialic acid-specific 9-O-acetylesterase [Pedosphaera sp.]|nr:Sialic acid-specific 9-O-acetylesterase [Pedosphaera sp.]
MIMKLKCTGALVLVGAANLFFNGAAHADVRLPNLFTDHMVLQQQAKVPVWGWADEGEEVVVTFRGQKVKTKAKDGRWMVKLSALKAGGPDALTVAGKNSLTLNDVLVGEVWICSGQSNMEFPLEKSLESKTDIEASANPAIRLFKVPKLKANAPTNDVKGAWQACNPRTVGGFSAVGYYFGRDLQKARGVPVGLIDSCWGGSPAEVWMSQTALACNPRYETEILGSYAEAVKRYEESQATFELEAAAARTAGKPISKNATPRPPWKPAELYNGMIAPLIPFAIKGAIWYQGESNAGRAEQYRTLFPDMIRNWRQDWNQGDFTFLAVQLAPYMAVKDEPTDSSWAELREAQLNTTKVLPKTGMAVITDVGNPKDIHPTKKRPVGERLALAARGVAYGEKIAYSGPVYRKMEMTGDKIILQFDHAGGGLEVHEGALKGFAICGEDHKFVWADAMVDAKSPAKIIVSSPAVAKPVAVRYGWADCPVVNLWNRDGLPASPFRTDDFPLTTAGKK